MVAVERYGTESLVWAPAGRFGDHDNAHSTPNKVDPMSNACELLG